MTTTHAKKSWLDHAASLLKYSLAILVGVIISQSISDWSGQALPVRTGQMLPTSRPAAQVSTTAQVDAWPSSEQTGLVANELKPKVTVAEQIAGLTKLIEADKQRHSDLEAELATLEQRFETASSDFSRLDAQRTQRRQQMPTATLDAESEMAWREARDEFDRIIQRRKAVQQQLDTLQEKLSVEQKMLERLTEATAPTETVDAALASQGPDTKPSSATANSEATSVGAIRSADREKNSSKTQSGDVEKALQQAMGVPVVENADSSEADTKDPVAAQVVASAAVDEQVAESLRKVDEDKRALQLAQGDLELVNHSIDVFGRDLKSSEALLAAADQELKAARQALEHTQKQIATRRQNEATDQTATESELGELLRREQEQTDRVQELHREFTKQTVRVNESKQVLGLLQIGRSKAMAEVEAMERVLADSQRRLWYLQSPLAPRRLFRWVTVSGPKVLAVLVLLTGLWWLTRFVGKKIVAEFVRRSRRGRSAEREQRAETLRRVFQNAAGLALLVIGGLAVLQLSGIDITVLLGGAAVLGAALAFGSQNLIKDYFAGFMILVENQYSVGNVVKIADISGSVEDITLRTTVLRDEEGSVHFIPHNQVTRVTNLTYGWSRVVLKVPISYRDDLAKVMELMVDIARELRDDSKYGPAILGEPDMQGIDSFDERGVTIKLLIMTRPLKQWEIKREYYKRMFDRFAQKGIEIPVPPQRLQISADEQREKIYSGTAQALR